MKFERLGDIAKIQIGKTPPRADSRFWGKGNLWVSIADLKEQTVNETKEEITDFAVSKCGCKLLPKGTLLMSFKLSIGKLAFAGSDLYTNEAICGILLNDSNRYAIEYLYYALKNTKLTGSNVAVKGATLNTASLKALFIPIVGNKATQLHIAKILSQAEGLIAQRRESIRLLDEYLKSVFLEMFGDPVRNEKGWEEFELKDVCSKIQDGTHFSPPITEKGRPYITAKHVRENIIDFWSNPWFISEESHKAIYKRCNPERGDVLYIKDGATTGYAAINQYDFEFSMLSSLALIKVNKVLLFPEYLCSWLNNPVVKKKILTQMAGGAIKRLTLTKINKLQILLPPLTLQTQFAQIVEKTEALKAQYQQSLQELENLYGSLSQRAFRGELNPKDGEVKYLEGLDSGVAAEPKSSYKR